MAATIDEIADEAEVATRTVSMFFQTQFDIAMSPAGDIAGRLSTALRDHPGLGSITSSTDD